MPLRGVIDSPDIPLNVSRSALTNHRTVRSIANHIAKKIADRLKSIYDETPRRICKMLARCGNFC
jgi:molecular chaperone HtpG